MNPVIPPTQKTSHDRWRILALFFIATTIN
jgi:hypothetical protein